MFYRNRVACVILYIVAVLTSLVLFGGYSHANPTWPRNPTDTEIAQAAREFLDREGPAIKEYRIVKYHDKRIQPVADGYNANEVQLFFMKKYDDTTEFGGNRLEGYNGSWHFSGGGCWAPPGSPSFSSLGEFVTWCLDENYYGYGWVSGQPPSQNRPPTVRLSYSPANPAPNDTIYFHADAADPDGDPLTYRWFLNDVEQTRATAPNVQWANPALGTHTMRVVVSDGKGGMAEDSVEFTVQAAQPRYVIMPGIGDLEGEKPIAFVKRIEMDGKVTYESTPGTPLYRGAFVKTGPGVEMRIVFRTGAWTRVKENTYFEIREERFVQANMVAVFTRLVEGIIDFYTKPTRNEKFEIETNMVVVGIKGTEVTIEHISGVTTVTVTEGEVEVTNKAIGAVSTVHAGETARFSSTTLPPPGTKTIEQALDTNNNKIIDDFEMLQALQYWIKQQIVPSTNKTIDDLTMLALLQKWIKGTPIQ